MIELFFTVIDATRYQPYLLLSGLQLAVVLVVIILLLPRRWQVMIGLATCVLLALLLFGRMP